MACTSSVIKVIPSSASLSYGRNAGLSYLCLLAGNRNVASMLYIGDTTPWECDDVEQTRSIT